MKVRDEFLPYWQLFAVIALIALACLGFAVALTVGVNATWQSSTPYLILSGLLGALLAAMGACYHVLRRAVRDEAQRQRRAIERANTDILTGAVSRAHFLSAFQDLTRAADKRFGFIHIDMDGLKVLNDSLGHKAGDRALAHLVACARKAAPAALVGRLGGDEFGVLLPDAPDKSATLQVGEAILRALDEPTEFEGRLLTVSATLGAVQCPQDGDCLEQLMTSADLALYKGKTGGRHVVVPFDHEMLVDERHRRFIARELRGAVLTGELDVHYQAVASAVTGEVSAYEALVRWNHSTRGMIPPGQFIPIAEQDQLIDLLGEWVLKRACRDLDLLAAPAVSVNVSPAQLKRPGFAARFLETVRNACVDPTRLIVEITETSRFLADTAEMQNIRSLSKAGVRIAIDDFGAGHASLEYLKLVPFNAIKIDRSYVADIEAHPVNQAVIVAIGGIGRSLGANVVAEGVETEAQHRLLQAAGCTHVQGYLIHRPEPLNAILARRSLMQAA